MKYKYTVLSFLLFEGFVSGLCYYLHPTKTWWYELPLLLIVIIPIFVLIATVMMKALDSEW